MQGLRKSITKIMTVGCTLTVTDPVLYVCAVVMRTAREYIPTAPTVLLVVAGYALPASSTYSKASGCLWQGMLHGSHI
jgi:hypothetical protein